MSSSWASSDVDAEASVDSNNTSLQALFGKGKNDYGQLGTGYFSPHEISFVEALIEPIRGGADGIKTILASRDIACALRTDRKVVCWGGKTLSPSIPASLQDPAIPSIVEGLPPLAEVWWGDDLRPCGIDTDGDPWCWPLFRENYPPFRLNLPFSLSSQVPLRRVSFNGSRGCVLRGEGDLWCWGKGFGGEQLYYRSEDSEMAIQVEEFGTGNLDFILSSSGLCVLSSNYDVRCSGHHSKTESKQIIEGVKLMSGTYYGNCAILLSTNIYCWEGQLAPVPIRAKDNGKPLLAGATSVVVGVGFGCAILTDATLWCWQTDDWSGGRRLKYSDEVYLAEKVEISIEANAELEFLQVASGGTFVLALARYRQRDPLSSRR